MSLDITPVPNCLEKKLTFLGYEVMDILFIFGTLSILNFTVGSFGKLAFVWMPTIALALILKFGKRGKPEKHLEHLAKFHLKPKKYSAFQRAYAPPMLGAGRMIEWTRH